MQTAQIAARLGYASQSQFATKFKAYTPLLLKSAHGHNHERQRTKPEATPVYEALLLEGDLKRVGISTRSVCPLAPLDLLISPCPTWVYTVQPSFASFIRREKRQAWF
jgi:hypothetical protein